MPPRQGRVADSTRLNRSISGNEKGPASHENKRAEQAIFLPAENLRLRLLHCSGPEQHRPETGKAGSEQVERV